MNPSPTFFSNKDSLGSVFFLHSLPLINILNYVFLLFFSLNNLLTQYSTKMEQLGPSVSSLSDEFNKGPDLNVKYIYFLKRLNKKERLSTVALE